jgi:hypothetical protein
VPKVAYAVPIAASLLALSACSVEAPAPQAPVLPSASPTQTHATEAQVVSVVAAYEPGWRETIDEAGMCRFDWVAPADALAEAHGVACWFRAQTFEIEAELAQRDFGELSIPTTMTPLVDDLKALLGLVASNHALETCGDGSVPEESDACNEKLANQFKLMNELDSKLDKWSPYL